MTINTGLLKQFFLMILIGGTFILAGQIGGYIVDHTDLVQTEQVVDNEVD